MAVVAATLLAGLLTLRSLLLAGLVVNGGHGAGRSGAPLANSERWTNRSSQRRAALTASSITNRTIVPMPPIRWGSPSAFRDGADNQHDALALLEPGVG